MKTTYFTKIQFSTIVLEDFQIHNIFDSYSDEKLPSLIR